MQEIFIGEFIRQNRIEQGKTQEELCAGLCDPSTLSRIETGKQAPSRNLARALLQRLSLPHDRYYTFLTASEAEADALRTKIDSCAVQFQQSLGDEKHRARLDALEYLDRLESLMEPGDNITRQYILASRAALSETAGAYRFEVKLNMLLEAIRLTVPKFDLKTLGGRLYSIDETEIIGQIARTYSEAGQHEKAAGIFNQLLIYVQEHYTDAAYLSRYLAPAALHYARELCLSGRFEEALETAELGQRTCLDYGYCQPLPELLAVMAKCKYAVGDYRRSKALYCQAYYFFEVIGNASCLALVKKEAREYLGLELPPQGVPV